MSQDLKIPASDEAWDAGDLGRDRKHAKKVKVSHEQRTKKDEGLDLQLISIRMPRSLIDDLKEIARLNNQKLTGAVRRPVERRVRPC